MVPGEGRVKFPPLTRHKFIKYDEEKYVFNY